jgi:acyl-CoA thioesterase
MEKHLDAIRKLFAVDPYARQLGIILDELTDTTIRMHMELGPATLNFYGRPHGAAIYSLADAAFSVLGNNTNNVSVALDCSITYHASPEPGSYLVVEGENLSMNKRTGSYIFTVYVEKDGYRTLIATMKSVSYRTGRPIDPDADR